MDKVGKKVSKHFLEKWAEGGKKIAGDEPAPAAKPDKPPAKDRSTDDKGYPANKR